jgi:hypothetical protein
MSIRSSAVLMVIVPSGGHGCWFAPPPSPPEGHKGGCSAKNGNLKVATSGNRQLATSGYFFMAMDRVSEFRRCVG